MTTGPLRKQLSEHLSTPHDDDFNVRSSFSGHSMRSEKPVPVKKRLDTPGCFSCFAKWPEPKEVDVVLVGAGIMSATVGLMLKELEPSWKIMMYERLGAPAEESTNGFNNAGTGHSAFMEPNYTKEITTAEGEETVDTAKARSICEKFMISRQYWAYLAKKGKLTNTTDFINHTPHLALGIGEEQVEFMKKRYKAMKKIPLFESMEFTEDPNKISEWAPLIMEGREPNTPIAMTRIMYGTDVDFGTLTKQQVGAFMKLGGDLRLFTTVSGLKKHTDGKRWMVTIKKKDASFGAERVIAKYVFVGAGGWALLMLQKAGIPQVRGYMAFSITGDWAVCQNPDVVKRHPVKVYAPGAKGAPPMSMPHLDKRTIGGKEMLLFGPFGAWTPKFLKHGSLVDVFSAIRCGNLIPFAAAGLQNVDLGIMLLKDILKPKSKKLQEIRHYFPNASAEDWSFVEAGVRAQIMKPDPKKVGILQFGTEVIVSDDRTICGLLGASPGASVAPSIALEVLAECFPDEYKGKWKSLLTEMVPSLGKELCNTPSMIPQVFGDTGKALNIK